MTTESGVLSVEFPRALRGYSIAAVEEFVREVGARLEQMQETVDTQQRTIDKLTGDLKSANDNLTAYIEKEAAIANAVVAMEQRKVAVEHEIEMTRTDAEGEIGNLLANARAEAANILTEAEHSAQETLMLAEQARALEEDRLRALCSQHDDTVGRIRRTLEAQLALLPNPGATLADLSISGLAVTSSIGAKQETEAA